MNIRRTPVASLLVCAALTLFPATPLASAGDNAPADRPRNSQGWTAVIDGKDVAAPELTMGSEATVRAILAEGKNNNQVMAHLRYLTKEIGPRLTGSAALQRANEWCRDQFASWGLANAHLDQWGTVSARFDRGPSSAKVVLRRERRGGAEPAYDSLRTLEITTLAWAAGTEGKVQGPVIREPKDEAEYAQVRDQLKGAWVLVKAPPPVGQRGIRGGMGARYTALNTARKKVAEGAELDSLSIAERLAFEDVLGFITTSRDERVWTGAIPGWRELDVGTMPKDVLIQVRLSDYDFINSRLADGDTIEVEADLQHTFEKGPIPVYNTIAEIPGTEFPNEYVIVSAHLDSWDGPGSEGATDNGTGSAVTLEAARILAAVGAKPRRTIRFIHWTGEEQGLLGSREYVESRSDEMPRISAVFVDDGGTNYQGGFRCADQMVEMLAAATAPTNYQFYSDVDQRWMNVNIRGSGPRNPRGGGSDHASFNRISVPGFFWDETGRADYGYGWHTQNDKFELAIEEYLVQSATNTAITAYRLASADTLLPRDLPEEAAETPARDDAPTTP